MMMMKVIVMVMVMMLMMLMVRVRVNVIAMIKPKRGRNGSDYANPRCDTASQHLSRDQDMDRGDPVT